MKAYYNKCEEKLFKIYIKEIENNKLNQKKLRKITKEVNSGSILSVEHIKQINNLVDNNEKIKLDDKEKEYFD